MFDTKTKAYLLIVFIVYGIGDIISAFTNKEFISFDNILYVSCLLIILLVHGSIVVCVLKNLIGRNVILMLKLMIAVDTLFLGITLFVKYISEANILPIISEIMLMPVIMQSIVVTNLYYDLRDKKEK